MNSLKISLIITVLNELQSIKVLAAALSAQSRLADEIIIVDGGSTDGTWAVLQQLVQDFPQLKLKVWPQAGNRSVGRNKAIIQASHPWIAITDAGCIPNKDWLNNLEKSVLDQRSKTQPSTLSEQIVVAGYYQAKVTTPFTQAVIPYVLVMPDQVNPQSFLPATRSMLVSKSVWQQLGGFNEELSDNEDYAFARKLQQRMEHQNANGYEEPLQLLFQPKAVVQWLPRTSLKSFIWMIFRFARGDAQAGLWRPKVALLFARYLVGILVLLGLTLVNQSTLILPFVAICMLLYSGWAIKKNLKYTPEGWYWLPILQITSDWGVMTGTVAGLLKNG